jgi:hypothetical protein
VRRGVIGLARAQPPRDERDLLRGDAEPVQRVAGHLDRELFLAEHDLVRARLLQVVGGITRVGSRHDADALVRAPRVFDDTARRLRVAKRDDEEDRPVQKTFSVCLGLRRVQRQCSKEQQET